MTDQSKRKRAPQTELRWLRRDFKHLEAEARDSRMLVNRLRLDLDAMTKERDDWRRRFDDLLRRLPEVSQ